MSIWWRIAYKGSRLTLGFIASLMLLSHLFLFAVYAALSGLLGEHGGPIFWGIILMPLIHLSACCIMIMMLAALMAGRHDLARILALIVLAIDIATILPVLIRLILLSLLSRHLGIVGGLAAPVIVFILVYFMEDLQAAAEGAGGRMGIA